MSQAFVDISFIGDKQLERRFKALEGRDQKKVIRKALRAGAKILKKALNASAQRVSPGAFGTGELARDGFTVKAGKRSRSKISIGLMSPTREELDIESDDPFFYPAGIEYGFDDTAPDPFIRRAKESEERPVIREIADEIGKGIVRVTAKA